MANTYGTSEPYGYGYETPPLGIFRRVSWGAIFAGLVVSLVTILLFTLLGMGIGLGAINPATEENPMGGIGIGAAIWLGITAIIALFLGGWTTAKLAGTVRGLTGVLHSIVMWGLVTIVSFFLMTSAIGMLIGGAASIVGKSISAVAGGISAVAPQAGEQIQQELSQRGITLDSMINEAKQLFGQSGKVQRRDESTQRGAGAGGGAMGSDVEQELRQSLQRIFAGGQTTVSQADKDSLVNLLVSRANMSRPDAETTVNGWIQQYQKVAEGAGQARAKTLQTTERAMDALSKAGIWLFILMLLEAGAAAAGGWLGATRERVPEST